MNALVLACMISILVVSQGLDPAADLPDGGGIVASVIASDPGTRHAVSGTDPEGEALGPKGDGNPGDPPQPVAPATWGALKAVFGR